MHVIHHRGYERRRSHDLHAQRLHALLLSPVTHTKLPAMCRISHDVQLSKVSFERRRAEKMCIECVKSFNTWFRNVHVTLEKALEERVGAKCGGGGEDGGGGDGEGGGGGGGGEG